MTDNYRDVPPIPTPAWAEIYRIAKKGNDAVVKIRGDEIQIIERESKVKYRVTLTTG